MKLEDELKMSIIHNPYQRATLNVVFTGAWMSERINRLLKPFGISEQQYNILRILKGQKGNPINLQDISERMVHKMSNTTRMIEKLRLKGLVERSICENNRRKVEIIITSPGIKLIEKLATDFEEADNKLQDKLTSKEAEKLAFLLDKIRE